MAERTVTISSLSKSHAMTGWRVGWLIGPPALAAHAANLALCMLYGSPSFIQDAATVALTRRTGRGRCHAEHATAIGGMLSVAGWPACPASPAGGPRAACSSCSMCAAPGFPRMTSPQQLLADEGVSRAVRRCVRRLGGRACSAQPDRPGRALGRGLQPDWPLRLPAVGATPLPRARSRRLRSRSAPDSLRYEKWRPRSSAAAHTRRTRPTTALEMSAGREPRRETMQTAERIACGRPPSRSRTRPREPATRAQPWPRQSRRRW